MSKTARRAGLRSFFRILKITIISGIIICLVAALLLFGAIMGCFGNMGDFDIDEFRLSFTSQLFYINSDGEPTQFGNLFYEQNRVWVDLEDIPLHMRQAAIAIEDERFERHHGVDVRRTTAAILNFAFRWEEQFGGSTITQQLIKNLTGDDATTPFRKIQEISRAVNLERQLTKDDIMELYLNTIHLANGNNGVQAAARAYFGVDVGELTVAQSAAIIGITQHPVRFCPFMNPERNRERQLLVLMKMLELGFLTEEEHRAARDEEIVFLDRGATVTTAGEHIHSYFVDQVTADVLEALINEAGYSAAVADRMLFRDGLRIYTTFNPSVQAAIDRVYNDVSNFPHTGVQSAIVIIDPSNGHVVGMSGGIGPKTANRTLNRATQSLRQPGSAIKPISVYAPAIENGLISPGSIFVCERRTFGGWTPQNANRRFNGPVTVDYALRWSLNTIPAQIVHQMGADRAFDFMTDNLRFSTLVSREERGGTVHSDRNLAAMALGGLTDGVSILEMGAAYVPFANGGIYHRPITFTLVTDMDGNEIIRREPETNRAMTEATAFMITQMLRGSISSGTGGAAAIPNQFMAGKTGSTDNWHDRWFVGYTTHFVAAVWYGFDIPRDMGGGNNPAAAAFRNVMTEVHRGLPSRTIPRPAGIVSATICRDSGLIPSEYCAIDIRGSRLVTGYFVAGRVPAGVCDRHVEHFICDISEEMATALCPPAYVRRVSILSGGEEHVTCQTHDLLGIGGRPTLPTGDDDTVTDIIIDDPYSGNGTPSTGTDTNPGTGSGTTSGIGTPSTGADTNPGTGTGTTPGTGTGTTPDAGAGNETVARPPSNVENIVLD